MKRSYFEEYEYVKFKKDIHLNRVTPQQLEYYSKSEIDSHRRVVASCIVTPFFILNKLAHDPNCFVRRAVASNPNFPLESLAIMLQNSKKDMDILDSILLNPNLDENLLDDLASMNDELIQINVLKIPKVSNKTLNMLVKEGLTSSIRTRAGNILKKRADKQLKYLYEYKDSHASELELQTLFSNYKLYSSEVGERERSFHS